MKYDSCGQVLIAKMNQDIKKYNKKVRITFMNDSTKITTFFTCILTHKITSLSYMYLNLKLSLIKKHETPFFQTTLFLVKRQQKY